MTKYFILISLVFHVIPGLGQKEPLVKNIQSWRVEVLKEATEWVKKRNIAALAASEWKIKNDSIPVLQIENSQAVKRLLSDKRTVIKVNWRNGSSSLLLDRGKLYRSVRRQIENYAKRNLEEDRKTILKNLKLNIKQTLPELYNEQVWDFYLTNPSIDSILPAFKQYIGKVKSEGRIDKKDSVTTIRKIVRIEGMAASSVQKGKKEYNDLIRTRKLHSKNYKLPSIRWSFDISDLVTSDSSWAASDITLSLERKNKLFMQVYFDTLQATVLMDMPIADSALCSGNLIENEIAMGREPKKFTPCGMITGYDCYGSYSPSFWEREKFIVQFDKNVTEDIQGSLAPAYDYLKSNKLELKKVSILAFASIEGETERNLKLAEERAAVMVKVLQKYEKDTIEAEIVSSENWKDFYKDLPNTPFAKWKTLDSLQIKALVNDTANSKLLEPWLKKHRYAVLEVMAQRKMSESEKMAKVKEQYKLYINNVYNASGEKRNYWEAKVAAMRNWLVKEYMAGRVSKLYADSLFKDMTPELQMVDFYQQLKVLQSKKELLGAQPEQWMLSIINSAKQRHEELDKLLTSGTLKNTRPTEIADEATMDFLRFSLTVTVNLVRSGKLPATIYNSIDLPQEEEYLPFNVLLDYAKNSANLIVIDKNKTPVIKFSEQNTDDNTYTEFRLTSCGMMDIYCKDHLYYQKLKTAILNPKRMTQGNKELMKKVTHIFLEVQISETNEWRGYYYDSDFDIFKVRKMAEELNLNRLCPVQKDKVMLEANRKAALFLYRKDKKNKLSKENSVISSYYIRQKDFVNAALAEKIARMLLWFESEANNSKNNLLAAQSFLKKLGVGTDKRYDSLIPLFERINKLVNKPAIIEEEASEL